MELIDTHCHIQLIGQKDLKDHSVQLWDKSKLTLDQVLSNARGNSVKTLMVVGCSVKDSQLAVNLASREAGIYASIGIHPHEATNFLKYRSQKSVFIELFKSDRVQAVGECGLDYFYEYSNKHDQALVLRFQIELAIEHKKALIFHVREAFDDFFKIIKDYDLSNNRVVVHSFMDSQEVLKQLLAKGFFIGVNGIATFTKNLDQIAMYKSIPLNRLVLETDSPYLTPYPLRGSINEPQNVKVIAQFLADLRGEELTDLAVQTSANAKSLFFI